MIFKTENEKDIFPFRIYFSGIIGAFLTIIGFFFLFNLEVTSFSLPTNIYGVPTWIIGLALISSGFYTILFMFKEYKALINEQFLKTQQIVIIALLSALGGTLSSFVSYLGLQLNFLVGTSEGAGQILGGAHVYWLLIIAVLVPRRGAVTYAGFIKGIIELFTGSPHGVLVILISIFQGFSIDMTFMIIKKLKHNVYSISSLSIAGSISCMSNIFVSQTLFYQGLPLEIIGIMVLISAISGIIFGGFLANDTLKILQEAGLWNLQYSALDIPKMKKSVYKNILKSPKHITTSAVILIFISFGSLFALTTIQISSTSPYSCNISGNVNNPYTFVYSEFNSNEVIIEAKLDGAVTHLPEANYTGFLLSEIITKANPKNGASLVRVIARDKYEASFNLNDILSDIKTIISIDENNNWLWLIAGNYEGSYWVKMVQNIIIE